MRMLLMVALLSVFLLSKSPIVGLDLLLRRDAANFSVVYLDIDFDLCEMIDKASIRISTDHTAIDIVKWVVLAEEKEEYIVALKTHKKVYKNILWEPSPLKIRIDFDNKLADDIDLNIYFSCFVICEEKIVPLLKKVSLHNSKKKMHVVKSFGSKEVRTTEKKGVSMQKSNQENLYDNFQWAERPSLGYGFLSTKYFFLLFVILLFIGFLVVDVLTGTDIYVALLVGSWFFLQGWTSDLLKYFSLAEWHYVGTALILFFASIWYLKGHNNVHATLWYTRLILGMACAAVVLPFLAQAYILFFVSKG